MASYNPPTENVPIFDTTLFDDPNDFLTPTAGDKRYLKYPVAQGKETLQEILVGGIATFNNNTTLNANTVFNGAVDFYNNTITINNGSDLVYKNTNGSIGMQQFHRWNFNS